MHRAVYNNAYDEYRAQHIHQKNLRKAKPRVDVSEPQEQPHLLTKAKKHELEEGRFAEIERENAILLAKMSKIMRQGAGTSDAGGAPPIKRKDPVGPSSLNGVRRKQELRRITQENQAILKRIQLKDPHYNHLEWAQERKQNVKYMRNHCVHPPPGERSQESKFARQLRGRVGKGSVTARSVIKNNSAGRSGAQTDRGRPAGGATAEERVHNALSMIRGDDMRLLLGMKRPPEVVKKVFASLMVLVSPFETTEADVSWEAVHEWVRQLQGVESFLDNLEHFEAADVSGPVVQRTLDYMTGAQLFPTVVKQYSGALATLCTWIWAICESAQPKMTSEYRNQQAHPPKGSSDGIESEEPEDDSAIAHGDEEEDYGFANGEEIGSPSNAKVMGSTS